MNEPLKHKSNSDKKSTTVQRKGVALQKKANKTGLPDQLKAGIENLSGQSMDDVKVHFNSSKPAQLQAHAYAQGTDIHLAPGQEKHLPHEAWHVVQQKENRVKPTMQLRERVNINDDAGLEKEADVMGAKAASAELNSQSIQRKSKSVTATTEQNAVKPTGEVFQLFMARVRSKKNQFSNELYISQLKVEGRPPTSDKDGGGDHTVAVSAMEFMLERIIDGKTHNFVAENIVGILNHVEAKTATKYLNEDNKYVKVNLGMLKDEIINYQQLVQNSGDTAAINEALETLLEAFIRLWNKTTGAAYKRSIGKTTGGSSGQDEKKSKKMLHEIGEKVDDEGSSPESAMDVAVQVNDLIDFVVSDIHSIEELAKHAARAIELIISGIPEIEFDYEQIGTTTAELLASRFKLDKNQEGLLDLYIMRILRDDPNMYSDLEDEYLGENSGNDGKDDKIEVDDD